MEAWIYPHGWGPFGTLGLGKILDKKNLALELVDAYITYARHSLLLRSVFQHNGSLINTNTPENSIALDQWQHVAVTYDGIGELKIYVNVWTRLESAGLTLRCHQNNSAEDLYIGNDRTGEYAFRRSPSMISVCGTVSAQQTRSGKA